MPVPVQLQTASTRRRVVWSKARYGMVLTPGKAIYVLAFWLLGPVSRLLVDVTNRNSDTVMLYIVYFLIAIAAVAVEYWPRRDPAAEGLRRAHRLLPIDPGMALVRGRGALEHSLRQAVENLGITVHSSDGQVGIHDLLDALHQSLPAELYQSADRLRRLANEAAHDPDWSIELLTASQALRAAVRVRRWVRFECSSRIRKSR